MAHLSGLYVEPQIPLKSRGKQTLMKESGNRQTSSNKRTELKD